MRLLIISTTYLPHTIAVAKLVHDLATEFVSQGHDPVILVPDPRINTNYTIATKDKISVIRFRSGEIKNTSMVKRAFNEWMLSYNAWRNAKSFFLQNKFDIIIFFSPSIFWTNLVKKLKKMWKCHTYMILRDIFPKWAVDAGLLKKNSPAHIFFKYNELKQYNVANVIGVQSPANIEYFKEIQLKARLNLDVLYNWVKVDTFNKLNNNYYRSKFNIERKIVFFYGGRFSPAHDIDNLVHLASSLKEVPIAHFILLGNGSEYSRIKEMITIKKLKNITIHPEVEQTDYLAMLSEFDIGLISLDKKLKTHNFPGKMLAYMQLSKPILASINPNNDLREIIENNNAGLVSLNGDNENLKVNALKLISSKELRSEMGRNAFKLVENYFSVRKATHQILSAFNCPCPNKKLAIPADKNIPTR